MKAIETRNEPENIYTPNIVEYQWGSKVMSQSKAAKLIVNAYKNVPTPDHFLRA